MTTRRAPGATDGPEESKEKSSAKAKSQPRRRRAKVKSEPKELSPLAELEQAMDSPPETVEALRGFIERVMGVRLVTTSIVAGHSAPMDYIAHAYFEGNVPGRAGSEAMNEAGQEQMAADCVVWANRGGGKTFLGALATALDLIFKPGIQVRILGGSLEQSKRMHEHLRTLFGKPGLEELVKGKITDSKITLINGSCAATLAASQTSVRGTRVQKLRLDEVDLFDPDVWEAVQLATRSAKIPGPWGKIVRGSVEALSTMHKPMGLMWKIVGGLRVMRDRGDGPPRGSTLRPVFRWGVLDVLETCEQARECATCGLERECKGRAKHDRAGGGHVSVDDALTMKARVGKATWEAEMLCIKPKRTDAVYPEFDVDRHVVPRVAAAQFERFIGGMDFGIRAEAVVLLAGVEPGGRVVVIKEHAASGLTVKQHAEVLRGWINKGATGGRELEFLGVDPAGRARSDQTGVSSVKWLRDAGFVVRSRASKIEEGVGLVRARLDPAAGAVSAQGSVGVIEPRLVIDEECVRLIECLVRYRYPSENPSSMEPVKTDGVDHACDALRYMILNLDKGGAARGEMY